MPLLEIQSLRASFKKNGQNYPVLFGLNLSIEKGDILALAGESGSGKTITALGILKLWEPPLYWTEGKILWQGKNIFSFSEKELLRYRGGEVAMIFQEPMTALNPVFSVGFQIGEVLQNHRNLSKKESKKLTVELLRQVGISEPEIRIRQYPFELSGGMRQRVMIAMALAGNPQLLLADEPTTALDVTIQAQILNLLLELNQKQKMAILLISHDLGIVAQLSHQMAVLYAGRIVEKGPTRSVLTNPMHPYTIGLLESRPKRGNKRKLKPIPGQVPSLTDIPRGCPFQNRCFKRKENCQEEPPWKKINQNHFYLCHF